MSVIIECNILSSNGDYEPFLFKSGIENIGNCYCQNLQFKGNGNTTNISYTFTPISNMRLRCLKFGSYHEPGVWGQGGTTECMVLDLIYPMNCLTFCYDAGNNINHNTRFISTNYSAITWGEYSVSIYLNSNTLNNTIINQINRAINFNSYSYSVIGFFW